MKRPLIPVALFYTTGILAAGLAPVTPMLLLTAGMGLLVLATSWSRGRAVLLGALLIVTGWANYAWRTAIISPNDLRLVGSVPQLVTLRARLAETPSQRVFVQDETESWRSLARLEVTALKSNRGEWQPAAGRVAVLTPGLLTNIFGGQTVEVFGVLRAPKLPAAAGIFDYPAYLRRVGIHYQLDTESEKDWQVIESPRQRPIADRFRDWARQALALGLPAEDESLRLEWALALGWKPALTEPVAEPFVRAATYHIFAVDGLRMAILFGIFFGLLRAVTVPRAVCAMVLVPLIWFYTALTGWPASAIRASVMLTVVLGGWVLNRPSNLMNSLFAAAFLILLWDPRELYQAGFQLSFCVVLVLLLAMPILHSFSQRIWAGDPLLPEALRPRWQTVLRVPGGYVLDVCLTSFAAWIGSIPLVALYFHIVTPVSTPANLVAVPLCGLVLMANFGSILLAAWFPAAAALFNHAGWFLMECIRVSSDWFAAWPKAYHYVAAPSLFATVLYYAVLLAFLTGWMLKPPRRFWRFAGLALALGIWGWTTWQGAGVTRMHIVPVNGGMLVYCRGPGTENELLVDCGTTNSVAFVTKPFLRAQGVNALEDLVLTHGDVRHVGGADMLADLFKINHVCVSPVRFRSPRYRRVINRFGDQPGLLRTVSRGDRIGPWRVLHPDSADRFPQADDNALVLWAELGGTRVLLLSDLGRLGQQALLERNPGLRADIVVTGLPSQSEALGEALLEATQPKLIIVADSEYPVWERAGEKLCARLGLTKARVVCTRAEGPQVIEFLAKSWRKFSSNPSDRSNRSNRSYRPNPVDQAHEFGVSD